MIENILTTRPIARKNYFCNLCNDYILKGTKHECQVNKFDGDIYTWRGHEECCKLAEKLDMYHECDYEEGLTDDFFCDFVSQYIIDNCLTEENESEWDGLTTFEQVKKIVGT